VKGKGKGGEKARNGGLENWELGSLPSLPKYSGDCQSRMGNRMPYNHVCKVH